MKREIALLLLMGIAFSLLAGCRSLPKPVFPETDSEEPDSTAASVTAGKPEDDDPVDPTYQPYELRFLSIGMLPGGEEGCILSDVALDENVTRKFQLTVPEFSPDGKKVVAVWTEILPRLVPRWIEKERFETLILTPLQRAKAAGDISDFYLKLFCNYFEEKGSDLETDATERAHLIETYPVLRDPSVHIYVLDPMANEDELESLAGWIRRFTDYTYDDLLADSRATGFSPDQIWGFKTACLASVRLPERLIDRTVTNNLQQNIHLDEYFVWQSVGDEKYIITDIKTPPLPAEAIKLQFPDGMTISDVDGDLIPYLKPSLKITISSQSAVSGRQIVGIKSGLLPYLVPLRLLETGLQKFVLEPLSEAMNVTQADYDRLVNDYEICGTYRMENGETVPVCGLKKGLPTEEMQWLEDMIRQHTTFGYESLFGYCKIFGLDMMEYYPDSPLYLNLIVNLYISPQISILRDLEE